MTRAQKLALRGYLRKYPDDRLAELLAHAQDGKLSYGSCCCFVGCLTADHPLRHPESGPMTGSVQHIYHAREVDSGSREKLGPAERAFMEIASGDADRRRLVIPLIRAEMQRRCAARIQHSAISDQLKQQHKQPQNDASGVSPVPIAWKDPGEPVTETNWNGASNHELIAESCLVKAAL